ISADEKIYSHFALQGTPVKTEYICGSFDYEGADIGISRTYWPENNLSYIEFFSPTACSSKNSIHISDIPRNEGWKAFDIAIAHYDRSNYIKVLGFIEQAFDAGLIDVVPDRPSVMVRNLPRF